MYLCRSYKSALSEKYRDVDKVLEEALMGASVKEERSVTFYIFHSFINRMFTCFFIPKKKRLK